MSQTDDPTTTADPAGMPPPSRVSVEEVLITPVLSTRPSRPPNLSAETRALHHLARHLTSPPEVIYQALVEIALQLCHAGTAGLSLLERSPDGREVFRWNALAGVLAAHVGGCTPREHSPCGTCLDRGCAQLYHRPARCFEYFRGVEPEIIEGLVVPIYESPPVYDGAAPDPGSALGTIWIVAHDGHRRFDAEDVRIMTSLAAFTAAAARSARLYAAEREARRLLATQFERAASDAAELRRSNADLERFALTASHDIQEPLGGIAAYVSFLREDLAGSMDDTSRERLDAIARLVGGARDLLRSLLFYAQAGHAGLAVEEVDTGAALNEVIEALGPRLGEESVRFEVDTGLPVVRCHREFLQQIFSNLITNAVKYNTATVKRVQVGALREGDGQRGDAPVVFFVRDNGIGIGPADRERVFQLFTRLRHGEVEASGTGAGLSIIKRLVERHGGRIWVDSTPGEGSTFFFTLGRSDERAGDV